MGERAIHARLESIGVGVSRYGLVVVLMLIGLLKFTPAEAAGIQLLVAHSPLRMLSEPRGGWSAETVQ